MGQTTSSPSPPAPSISTPLPITNVPTAVSPSSPLFTEASHYHTRCSIQQAASLKCQENYLFVNVDKDYDRGAHLKECKDLVEKYKECRRTEHHDVLDSRGGNSR